MAKNLVFERVECQVRLWIAGCGCSAASHSDSCHRHCMVDSQHHYDYVVVGSGPGASAWLHYTLTNSPSPPKILLLERGPFSKVDVLTEPNPFKVLSASKRIIANYNHGVMQGKTLGGGTAVNNYAWVTPSYRDLKHALGITPNNPLTRTVVKSYESLVEQLLGDRQTPHPLHQHLTSSRPTQCKIVTSARIIVEATNRQKVFLGCPTLNSNGERRSGYTGVVEPLWREYFDHLHIKTDVEVKRVLFNNKEDWKKGVQPPHVRGVETYDGQVFTADTVVLSCGCLETPAVLMRSGIGPATHLRDREVDVIVDNPHVGQHLKDKMLLDDMIITDSAARSFDKSLLLVNRVFQDGVSVQLHRYDKWTVGNSYLAMTRLLRGAWQDILPSKGMSMVHALRNAATYLSPAGYNAFCFQTYVKMESEASVSLSNDGSLRATLNANNFFQEVKEREAELKKRVELVYKDVHAMRDHTVIQYQTTVPAILNGPLAPHWRLVWHFAGTCRVGEVLHPDNFGVKGVRGLYVADMSACRVTSDGGTMGMAYLTGTVAAAQMLKNKR